MHLSISNPPHRIGTVADLEETQYLPLSELPNCFASLGSHIIAEFTGCSNLNNYEMLESTLTQAAIAAQATILKITTHHFTPSGMTGLILLQESHMSVHTWPEYGYASIDIYTCGEMCIEKALLVFEEFFKPTKIRAITITRGFEK